MTEEQCKSLQNLCNLGHKLGYVSHDQTVWIVTLVSKDPNKGWQVNFWGRAVPYRCSDLCYNHFYLLSKLSP